MHTLRITHASGGRARETAKKANCVRLTTPAMKEGYTSTSLTRDTKHDMSTATINIHNVAMMPAPVSHALAVTEKGISSPHTVAVDQSHQERTRPSLKHHYNALLQ
jgi:hypothetical protein